MFRCCYPSARPLPPFWRRPGLSGSSWFLDTRFARSRALPCRFAPRFCLGLSWHGCRRYAAGYGAPFPLTRAAREDFVMAGQASPMGSRRALGEPRIRVLPTHRIRPPGERSRPGQAIACFRSHCHLPWPADRMGGGGGQSPSSPDPEDNRLGPRRAPDVIVSGRLGTGPGSGTRPYKYPATPRPFPQALSLFLSACQPTRLSASNPQTPPLPPRLAPKPPPPPLGLRPGPSTTIPCLSTGPRTPAPRALPSSSPAP